MAKIKSWCQTTKVSVKSHGVMTLVAQDPLEKAVEAVAKAVPSHYASRERMAKLLAKLGKPAAAKYLKDKLPKSARIRSGDLGEILGASFVDEFTDFDVSVNKLRWKDHRNMAMRGDDLIGIEAGGNGKRIRFLKGEVKSAATMSASTVTKARNALKAYQSKPSPHALEFIADRLHEEGEDALADEIDQAILVDGVSISQVSHLIFTFCGNDPTTILTDNVKAYTGKVPQIAASLRVPKHQNFIASVYKKVASNADGK